MTTQSIAIRQYKGISIAELNDLLAIEAPLEIRLRYGPAGARTEKTLSITMRTPGADGDLVSGFLYTEGLIRAAADLETVQTIGENTVLATLHPAVVLNWQQLERHFYTTSSCGVCGKTSIEALQTTVQCAFPTEKWAILPEIIYTLPDKLRQAQATFDATGGIHAAALFDHNGTLLALREDVGRHNALDKLIGHCLYTANMPMSQHILLLSGRASFELIQKAAMAGIGTVCAVGAPSSLAVETAQSFGIQLIGFLRGERFNVYTG